jgi:hypothetical protein
MKNLTLIAFIFLFACNKPATPCTPIVIHDTVYKDTAYVKFVEYDTVVVGRNDSLIRRLNASNYKLARVKFYLTICKKNSSQDKFLKGWLNRVFE